MIGEVRLFIKGLLTNPPACPHCGGADLRRSQRPSPFARFRIHRYRCRSCLRYFFLRRRQVLDAPDRICEYYQGDAAVPGGDKEHDEEHGREPSCGHAGRRRRTHSHRRHHEAPPADAPPPDAPSRPGEPVDLDAVERELAAARARIQRKPE